MWAAFYLMVRVHEGHEAALKIATPLMLAGPLPVYAHFVALQRLFERRRYFAYGLALLAIVLVSAICAESIHALIDRDPNSHTNGLGVAILFLTFSTGIRYFSRGMGQQYRLQEAEFKRLQAEMALLRSQLNPHFMFNTLNSLYALSLDRSERLPDVILKLCELMRYALESSQRDRVPLQDEIRFLESYVTLERLRLSGEPDVRLQVNGGAPNLQIAPMLLVPLVENGFKHSGVGPGAGGYVHMNLEATAQRVRFSVVNDTSPAASPAESSGDGLGLANLKRRLELLYPGSHELKIAADEARFRVELTLVP